MDTLDSAAASLQNLNDVVSPAPVPWWPLAPGWYLLAAAVFALTAWLAVRAVRAWLRNRYRREALGQLAELKSVQSPSAWREVPALMKRTALACFPREQVAALSGDGWLGFLNATMPRRQLDPDAGMLLRCAAYETRDLESGEISRLFAVADDWIRHHDAPSG